jgi:UDP-N-acetylmuramoyl-tripeptide--D-alanyl-D-alanine ligase
MDPILISEVAGAVGGRMLVAAPTTIRAVCTDTRDIRPDSLFVALRGDTFDGHDYLAQAAAGGAVAALVDRDVPPVPGLALLRVDDARRAMGRLATFVRRRFKGTVIAVVGSNGKTGTKHLIHAALSSELRGTMSPKSFNNDVGVPVTLFAADPSDDFVVLEMGTNHPGEIAHLSRMAEPDVAVITNVGAEHLEFFGDLAGVARENAQVVAGMGPTGRVFVNGDDASVVAHVVTGDPGRPHATLFGSHERNLVRPSNVRGTIEGTTFDWVDVIAGSLGPLFVPLLGRHTATNAIAAVLVASDLGVPYDHIRRGLAAATGPAMRLQLDRAGPVTILNDAYNANPTSMAAALETVRDLPTAGRRIAVLGDMLEMGDAAAAGHADVGRLAAASNLDALVCVGPLSATIAAAATAAGLANVSHLATTADAAAAVPPMLRAGDLVLLKASRGMRLEKVAAAIHAAFG